ncbi:MAG: hypothetical protein KGS61_05380 [Verrucomicrobia bacterium]|nr:hypothetical protein [Verrucomicrobiota bacterium]
MLRPRLILIVVAVAVTGLAAAMIWRPRPPVAQPLLGDPSAALFQQFQTRLWPLFTRGGDHSCVDCHDADNDSDLHFLSDPESSFKMLIEKGYFAASGPDSLLGRLSTTHPKRRMPKNGKPWTPAEIKRLRDFVADLNQQVKTAARPDEQFPSALLTPYHGPVSSALDNQFISYTQLRGKIRTIFHDDGVRNGHDLFEENIGLFGGADFTTRFNESTKASATFLSGVALIAREVATRAYTRKTGPFVGRPEHLPSPLSLREPDAAYTAQITRLYRTILFRSPSPAEIREAFALLRNIYQHQDAIRASDYDLSLQLTVSDPATGLRSTRALSIPVSGQAIGLYQELMNESAPESPHALAAHDPPPPRHPGQNASGRIGQHRLARSFRFRPDVPGQCFRLSNVNTVGNVSFQALEIQPLDNPDTNALQRLTAASPLVQAEGAWNLQEQKGFTSFDDENNDKGGSTITVPISVPKAGLYAITVRWRQSDNNADGILAEVVAPGLDQLTPSLLPPQSPPGQADYHIDESIDTLAFADLQGDFQFGPDDYVELSNRGTRRRVTADAVKFVPPTGGPTLVVGADEADGHDQWQVYRAGEFEAYNKVGKHTYEDGNAHKGDLRLRYRPSLRGNWKAERFYHVLVAYPAKRDQELATPVIVRARKSSPILRLAYPAHARAGASVQLDASSTFTIQGGDLRFTWEQLDGPALPVKDWHAPVLRFVAPRLEPEPVAWVALCQALMRHPDFLFTRPPSIETVQAAREKRQLQLVKLALDLVGRPPSAWELNRLADGASLSNLADYYLQTREFKDFYFHRIRLYVESHGTETQDEPARLWCYVAFHDRPFQEILTADYTVDPQWHPQPRPAYCGHTGVLTTRGFIEGKPGLPHFNYAAQVAELFLGYVFEVPPEVVQQRANSTAASTTDPNSICYSCHKVLTPLAFQRTRWDDDGHYRVRDEYGLPIDDTDNHLVPSYPFAGEGLQAFATQAVRKERFIRAMINTHFTFYFGRGIRYETDERGLYKHLWDAVHTNHFTIRALIRALVTSPEYLQGRPQPGPPPPPPQLQETKTAPITDPGATSDRPVAGLSLPQSVALAEN